VVASQDIGQFLFMPLDSSPSLPPTLPLHTTASTHHSTPRRAMPHTYGTTTSTGNGQQQQQQQQQPQEEEEAYRSRPNHAYQGLNSDDREGGEQEEGKRDLPTTRLPVVPKTYYEEDQQGEYLARRVRQAGMGVALIVSVCACLMLFGLKGRVSGGGGGRGSLPSSAAPATGVGPDDVLLHQKRGVHRPQELRQPEVR